MKHLLLLTFVTGISLAAPTQTYWSLPITTESVYRIAKMHCLGSSTYRYQFPTIQELRSHRPALATIVKDFDKFELPPFVWSSESAPNDPNSIMALNVETGEIKPVQTIVSEGTYGPYGIVLCVCRMVNPRPACSFKDVPEKGYVFSTTVETGGEPGGEPGGGSIEPALPSPDRLLELAKQDPAAFIRALSDAEPVVTNLSDGPKLIPYLRILDALKAALPGAPGSLAMDALARFARVVTRNAVKFIQLDRDDFAIIDAFLRWADDDSRARLATLHGKLAVTLTDRVRALELHRSVGKAIALLRVMLVLPYVLDEFESLESNLVGRLLSLTFSLSDSEISEWVPRLESGGAFQRLSDYAAERSLKSSTAEGLVGPTHWLILAVEKLRKSPALVGSDEIAKGIGRTNTEVVARFLSLGGVLDEVWISRFLASLTLLIRVEFSEAVESAYRFQRVPDRQYPMLLIFVDKLLAEFKLLQLTEPMDQMARFRRRLVMMRVLNTGIEGTYGVFIDGSPATLTLTLRDYGTLFAVLSFNGRSERRDFTFFHVTQSPETNTFEAVHYNKEYSHLVKSSSNHYLTFQLTKSQESYKILGRFFDGAAYHSVTGTQTAQYQAQYGLAISPDSLTGNYRGTVGGKIVELSVTHLEESLRAQFRFNEQSVGLAEGYWERPEAAVFFTSGETETDFRSHHVRGQFTAQGMFFKGVFIMGGSGIRFPLELVKVAD